MPRVTRSKIDLKDKNLPLSVPTIALREILQHRPEPIARFDVSGLGGELLEGSDSAWLVLRRPGKGGLALRCGYALGGLSQLRWSPERDDFIDGMLTFEAPVGRFSVRIWHDGLERPVLRVTTVLEPRLDTLVTHFPRDLYPLDGRDDPAGAVGHVEAAQRGLNAGVIYFRFKEPAFGDVLYVQNLTALNPYFVATRTTPDAAVGGEWPELGYLPPTPPQAATPPIHPLRHRESYVLSDAILVFGEDGSNVEPKSALKFLQMLAAAYPHLDRPGPAMHDWVGRARRTLKDLDGEPGATTTYDSARFIRPYLDAEYPDSMTQLSILAALRDWEAWSEERVPLVRSLTRGVSKFYDRSLGTLRRYLPNVGSDKNADAVDSWYLYHPLLNLSRLAKEDEDAKALLAKCLDFGINAARHFNYAWPIQFDIKTFEVLTKARNQDGLGQTDVGGLYAYVMLQAFGLFNETRFLDEARAALNATRDMRFELEYQANLTAWGAAACLRLHRITGERTWLEHSYVFVASLLHNSVLWEGEMEGAKHYQNFLGATCLHDAPYLAAYECYDSFCALEEYLKLAGPDLDDCVRLLVSEYCRYALSRAWFFYPDTLPPECIATTVRNGRIDRSRSFPLEDLYADGQKAGQVGQEIYGAGAAPSFAVRAFHRLPGAPFLLFCDQFVAAREVVGPRSFVLSLTGSSNGEAHLVMVRAPRRKLPELFVSTREGRTKPANMDKDRIEYVIPADARVVIEWDAAKSARSNA